MHNYTGQRKRKVMMAEKSNAFRDNSVITIQRDGVTTIFPLSVWNHIALCYNMNLKSYPSISIRQINDVCVGILTR